MPRNFPDGDIHPLIIVGEVQAIVRQATYSGRGVARENYTVIFLICQFNDLAEFSKLPALLSASPECSAVPRMWQGLWKHLQTCPLEGSDERTRARPG